MGEGCELSGKVPAKEKARKTFAIAALLFNVIAA
jgi:hypothetical protein